MFLFKLRVFSICYLEVLAIVSLAFVSSVLATQLIQYVLCLKIYFLLFQTPQNIALLNNQNIRAIYSAHADGSIARRDIKLPLKTDSLNPALLSPAISSTSASTHNNHNKKIFYVKGKQNIEASNNWRWYLLVSLE